MSPVDLQEPQVKKPPARLARAKLFVKEAWQELKMVTFPTWPEVRASVLAVLLFILIVGGFVFLVDQLCQRYLDPLMFRH